MRVNFICHTNGKGLWSTTAKAVKVLTLELGFANDEQDFGELRVGFDDSTWSVEKYGLIYTDRLFINELRDQLMTLGFTKKSALDVDYSEQGMQGDDYVSLDIGAPFLAEYLILDKS